MAEEGINATISGIDSSVQEFLNFIKQDCRLSDLTPRDSYSKSTTFYRLKIFLRNEIVTLGDDSINPSQEVGKYIEPEDWNSLISDPDVVLIDTRNDYEVEIGTFEGAINPQTKTFREWNQYVEEKLTKIHIRN